mmetsp:Transcript_32600/g.52836  ORF Transcript_32600/g.52836 Transcript_32600/m.52836 type:complete len:235 (-) Transcript_32600:230-934(-)
MHLISTLSLALFLSDSSFSQNDAQLSLNPRCRNQWSHLFHHLSYKCLLHHNIESFERRNLLQSFIRKDLCPQHFMREHLLDHLIDILHFQTDLLSSVRSKLHVCFVCRPCHYLWVANWAAQLSENLLYLAKLLAGLEAPLTTLDKPINVLLFHVSLLARMPPPFVLLKLFLDRALRTPCPLIDLGLKDTILRLIYRPKGLKTLLCLCIKFSSFRPNFRLFLFVYSKFHVISGEL